MVLCATLMLCAAQAFAVHTEVATAPRLPFMRGGFFRTRWRKDVDRR